MFLLELVMCKHSKHTEIDFLHKFLSFFRQIQQQYSTINKVKPNYHYYFSELALPRYLDKKAMFNTELHFL